MIKRSKDIPQICLLEISRLLITCIIYYKCFLVFASISLAGFYLERSVLEGDFDERFVARFDSRAAQNVTVCLGAAEVSFGRVYLDRAT